MSWSEVVQWRGEESLVLKEDCRHFFKTHPFFVGLQVSQAGGLDSVADTADTGGCPALLPADADGPEAGDSGRKSLQGEIDPGILSSLLGSGEELVSLDAWHLLIGSLAI